MGHTPFTLVESKIGKLSHISTKPRSSESQTTASATHANAPIFFLCAHCLMDPAFAVGNIDNIEFRSDKFLNGEMVITQQL